MQEMLRALLAVLLLLSASPTLWAQEEVPRIAPRPLASALDAMRGGRWETARSLAARDGPAAELLIEWHFLQAGLGTPEQILAFLEAYPDWPSLDALRKRNEEKMAQEASPDQIIAFYDGHRPQTGFGTLSLATAHLARDQLGEAEATLVLGWLSLDLNTEEHEAFLTADPDLLAPYHAARLDMALWRGLKDVEVMLPLVSEEERALAKKRLTLDSHARADDMIAGLSETERMSPGIAHALFNRYLKSDRDAAIALINAQSRIEGGLGRPDAWASWRRALARDLMRDGKAEEAYVLAAMHQLTEGSNYADLEWLSGYLALTYLDDPELALDHFQRFRAAVATPISLGRAGYWLGRAQEAIGDPEAAALAYAQGGEHQTSFYGLLAAERAKIPFDTTFEKGTAPSEWNDHPPVVDAAILALAAGESWLAERFITHLGGRLDRTEIEQLGYILEEMGEPHLQVMLAKSAAQNGMVLPVPYYPLHPMTDLELPVPMELALAIARRESEFDPGVVSGAGAQGLMQVMPGTARDVARGLGLPHDPARLLSDWEYNTRLGATYLAQMAERFDGNIIMVSAAYNAGPARPPQWIERFGDPRLPGGMDIIDWIEHIPFRETRNYVMRVSESLPIYRARLGENPLPIPFSKELTGATIRPVSQ
jgi:soluble lytic murein transglycosylase